MNKKLGSLAILLLVISGIVWGVIGLFGTNLVEYIFTREWLIRLIYVVFGFAFIYHTICWRMDSKKKKTKR